MTEGGRRGGFESFTVLLKLGHDLRARLDDTLSAPLPDAFGPMLDALRTHGEGDAEGDGRGPGPDLAAAEPATSNVVPLAPRRSRGRARTDEGDDR